MAIKPIPAQRFMGTRKPSSMTTVITNYGITQGTTTLRRIIHESNFRSPNPNPQGPCGFTVKGLRFRGFPYTYFAA